MTQLDWTKRAPPSPNAKPSPKAGHLKIALERGREMSRAIKRAFDNEENDETRGRYGLLGSMIDQAVLELEREINLAIGYTPPAGNVQAAPQGEHTLATPIDLENLKF